MYRGGGWGEVFESHMSYWLFNRIEPTKKISYDEKIIKNNNNGKLNRTFLLRSNQQHGQELRGVEVGHLCKLSSVGDRDECEPRSIVRCCSQRAPPLGLARRERGRGVTLERRGLGHNQNAGLAALHCRHTTP